MTLSVCFLSAELAPWAKAGGLGDVVAALSLELARQAAATERGREVTRRFLGEGTPYTPQSVNFYNR